jgi:regulatory protein
MIISEIKQQARLKGRFSVFVDGKYSFSLSDTALLDSKLIIGQEVTAQDIKRFKQLSVDDKILGNALRYAAMRHRSRWEMENYLQRKQASPAIAEQILNKLTNLQMLDDLQFAQAWIENRRLLRPTSKRKLQQELRAKRVPDDIISQALGQDETSENQVLRELVERKRRQTKYHDQTKLMQYLARQGFGYGDIKEVLAELDDPA